MNIEISNVAKLPSRFGMFKVQAFKEDEKEHLVIIKEPYKEPVNIRIHSECLTGDAIGSLKCDCRDQLEESLKFIEKNGGMVIYLRQEGRNIGLFNKINAYNLQDKGLDTIEANHQLGFKTDERTYEIVDFILKYYKIKSINLLTNNPKKLMGLHNVKVAARVPIIIKPNKFNEKYLQTKKNEMGHLLDDNKKA
ncbi:GTP cyclohydrolase II [Campylobacter hominis]|uniref:GTP cyclohydrolase-2 n=1 Tax=Campylobacter hominis (strain ATCC BAA-381 / DSM 21671 / CCUG 45161 / LMG 19568 / NCTC 13146 / CH001A) TaxID=360107 RepID=RIBA_CAMHC|nr:GTP cyclohydrolase II [Campylobacter hominis]A7I3X0.1 RecName: Full=GTP cyclohydrolase-2; AltName: Full=GTP cyclohydrolase II [Campylobacter hominis ATCC BAA-381]ABS52344.1 GTP cyclohydrolase II [Campylobacter hominis ATCC BAA-381]UAK85588.1 GTP cyclohydrolase II [Campylobacter hominis]SUW85721.1 GTP cyclohydrolase II [Campylobacter hominis]